MSARGDAWSLHYRDATCDRIDNIILPAIGSKSVADLTWDDTAALVKRASIRAYHCRRLTLLISKVKYRAVCRRHEVVICQKDRTGRTRSPPAPHFATGC